MPKFRKKPVVVEARQYTGKNGETILSWAHPHHLGESRPPVTHHCRCLVVPTLEGPMFAKPGDYIIKGVKGEVYPCKPDIFELTYEAIEE